MGEYISRETAISKIRDEGVLGGDYDAYEREEDVVDMLNSIPAADVVEVVRCRDCILARKPDRRKPAENRACEGTLICCVGFDHVYPDTDDGLIFIDENFYCAEGKRKDGGQDDE